MPTFRDINQFNAVADTEVNPDWTLQVSATQRVTLRQIAQLVDKPKRLTVKVGETTKSYDTTREVEVDINPSNIGAAPVKHSHIYSDVTGNSLSLVFNTGGGKRLGIDDYVGGKYNKQISTLELLSASKSKNPEGFLQTFPLGGSNLSMVIYNDIAEINMTNQEFHMRIPFTIISSTSSATTLPQGLYVGQIEYRIPGHCFESLAFPELLLYAPGHPSAICMKRPLGTSSVIIRTGGALAKMFLLHVQALLIDRPTPDDTVKLLIRYHLDLYQEATYVQDSLNVGVIDIRVPIDDLIPWDNTTEEGE